MKTHLLTATLLLATFTSVFAADKDQGFVVHEWGTFTSVQGADGVQMIWNPWIAPELPKFVYDWTRARGAKIRGIVVAGKTGTAQRQRMETPVIYFYSDRVRTLDVAIRFPEGTVTEWYPQESAADFGMRNSTAAKTRPVLHWERVEVLPKAEAAGQALPLDPSGSHYYAARETDSALLRVMGSEKKTEVEKFLFYRGVAGFQAPLTVKLDSADPKRIALTNTGTEELRSLFIYEVRADGGIWVPMEKLKPRETRMLSLDAATGNDQLTALPDSLRAALVREGLYEREAEAMVKTWESSWFAERGVRVLYTLPRAWTDRTLPLTITPAPRATQRVMLARAEVITPAMELALREKAERYVAAAEAERSNIVAETRAIGLGRFIEPAMRRVMASGEHTREFNALAWELLQAASIPVKPVAPTAAAN